MILQYNELLGNDKECVIADFIYFNTGQSIGSDTQKYQWMKNW